MKLSELTEIMHRLGVTHSMEFRVWNAYGTDDNGGPLSTPDNHGVAICCMVNGISLAECRFSIHEMQLCQLNLWEESHNHEWVLY